MSDQAEAQREAADQSDSETIDTATIAGAQPAQPSLPDRPATSGGAPGSPPGDDEYTFRQVVDDDLGGISFEDAIAGTIIEFDDGDIVKGTIVKVDKDEVLLDIGYKSEGVIPARELSIRHDVDPGEIVTIGDEIEALVMQKEDKEGRLVLSTQQGQYE